MDERICDFTLWAKILVAIKKVIHMANSRVKAKTLITQTFRNLTEINGVQKAWGNVYKLLI